MSEGILIKKVYGEIKNIRKELLFIKKHMFDPDTIMTIEENRRFEQSLKELKEGKTTPLSVVKKELGL